MIIYKYLPPESALKTVKNNSVLLRTPFEYNDPFDCLFFINEKEKRSSFKLYLNFKIFEKLYTEMIVENKKPTRLKFYSKIMKGNLKALASEIKNTKNYRIQKDITMYYKFASKILRKNENEFKVEFEQMMNDVVKKMRESVVVSCFGSTYDSFLMWSHYADKHKGACIEFEVEDKDFKQVDYFENLYVFEFTRLLGIVLAHKFLKEEVDSEKEEYQFALKPLFIKSKVWDYEGEIRCVYSAEKQNNKIYSDEEGLKFLKMPQIKRIIVGCNADDDFVRELVKAADRTPVKRMKMSNETYAVLL